MIIYFYSHHEATLTLYKIFRMIYRLEFTSHYLLPFLQIPIAICFGHA